jgi:hypothetical protein
MGKKDPRIDAYIANSADFAKPILKRVRKAVHAGCPEVEETLKWSFPHFLYKGILCSMASFKEHCAFGFWKGKLLEDKLKEASRGKEPAMGDFGRLTSASDLPDEKTLTRLVREAVKLNDLGIKNPARSRPKGDRKLAVPGYFLDALKRNKKAWTTFEGFNYSNQKEYVEWVGEAKGAQTRQRRLETAVEWMREGKIRNWKYLRK